MNLIFLLSNILETHCYLICRANSIIIIALCNFETCHSLFELINFIYCANLTVFNTLFGESRHVQT